MNTHVTEIRRRIKATLAGARAERIDRTADVLPLLTDRARLLGQLLVGACGGGGGLVLPEGAGYGSEVVLVDMDSGERFRIRLMSADALDLDAGHITVESPLGRSLIGRAQGDVISFETPRGPKRVCIASVETLSAFLDRLATERSSGLLRIVRTRPGTGTRG